MIKHVANENTEKLKGWKSGKSWEIPHFFAQAWLRQRGKPVASCLGGRLTETLMCNRLLWREGLVIVLYLLLVIGIVDLHCFLRKSSFLETNSPLCIYKVVVNAEFFQVPVPVQECSHLTTEEKIQEACGNKKWFPFVSIQR